MNLKITTIGLLMFHLTSLLNAASTQQQYDIKTNFGFIENNGQVVNQFYDSAGDVKFLATNKSIKLILRKNLFSYQLQSISDNNPQICSSIKDYDNDAITYKFHRVDVSFLNSNLGVIIEPIEKSEDYINYYNLKNSDREYIRCYHYKAIRYRNIYDNIDFIFYTDAVANKFKYDIILHPGANIQDIKLKFDGQEMIFLEGNVLSLITSFGNINELIPKSFYDDGSEVKVDYNLNNNILSFSADYDRNERLTIDPILSYATYFGGSANDVGLEISLDINDNIVITGFTASIDNIATTAAYQTEMKGDNDVIVVKYNSSGARTWATYFGGTGYDTGHGVSTDINGNIAVGGWTKSTSNISTQSSHQSFHSGGEFDGFIAKFTSSGTREWATYYGGQEDDYVNDVVIDGYSDIICIGRTSSYAGIASMNGHQFELGGGNDAFVAKFSTNGVRRWGSYFGGSGFDVGMEVSADVFNNIAITGYTQSSNGIASENAHKKHRSGIWDAFVAKLDRNGKRIWSTYFGGQEEDNGRGVDFDGNGNLYMTGNTFSSDSISTTGVHQTSISSDESECYVAKFDPMGELVWATYFGGNNEDIGNVATISPWNRIIITGNTKSENKIATPDANLKTNAGLTDAFVASFKENGQIDFASYYGGSDNDYAHGITYNKRGDFFFTGYTGSSSKIATSDAAQPEYGGSNDAYIAKFSNPPRTDSVIVGPITGEWCADMIIQIPYTVKGNFAPSNVFTVQLSSASGRFVDYHNIGQIASNNAGTITAKIPKEAINGTNYRIRIIATEPEIVGSDNGIDLIINELPNPAIEGETFVCSGDEYHYKSNKSDSFLYKWSVQNGTISGNADADMCKVTWRNEGEGTLKLVLTNSQSGCKDSIIQTITINPKLKASAIKGITAVCPKSDILYYTTSSDDIINEWKIENGVLVQQIGKDSILVNWDEVKKGTVKLKQISTITNCADSISMTISMFDLPKPAIIGSNIGIAFRKSIYKTQPSNKYNIHWKIEGGTIADSSSNNIIDVLWADPGDGKVKLILTDKESGCCDSVSMDITINNTITEVIIGDTIVCAYTSYLYSSLDTNYLKKWYATGGSIVGVDTLHNIEVLWESSGSGKLEIVRKHRYTNKIDTTELLITIKVLPDGVIYGNGIVCETTEHNYFTDSPKLYERKWIAVNGKIIGDNSTDSVKVVWNEIDKESGNHSMEGKLELVLYDTVSGCSNSVYRNLTINKNPEIELVGELEVCRNINYSYTTHKDEESEISWTVEGGVIVSSQGDTVMIVQWQSNDFGRITITENSVYGCSGSDSYRVTILKSPEKPSIQRADKDLISSSDSGNQWFLDSTEIKGAINKIYTPVENGKYIVQVTGATGCKSVMSEEYYFDVNSVIDINDQNSIGIFPNPANEFVILKINSDIYNIVNVQLMNYIGELLFVNDCKLTNDELKLDLSDYSIGIYFVIITFEDGKKYYKRVVKL